MKSILISIKPKWVAKILGRDKTIEIRKTAPKCELPIDVYIYCTKGAYIGYLSKKYVGKVVAKFTLRKVEEIKFHILTKTNTYGIQRIEATFTSQTLSYRELTKLSCLAGDYLMEYLNDTDGYAWHVSDLQLLDNLMKPSGFDNLMELSDFGLKRAPQSWCYVEKTI